MALDEVAAGGALDVAKVVDGKTRDDDAAPTPLVDVEVDRIPVRAFAADDKLTRANDSRLTMLASAGVLKDDIDEVDIETDDATLVLDITPLDTVDVK